MHSIPSANPRSKWGGKLLWPIVVLIIAASWVGNVWYYKVMQLENPVFLKHYVTINGFQNELLELSFLENKKNGRKVTGVRLEELPMLRFQINPYPDDYRHQQLGKAYAEWSHDEAGQLEKVPLTIKEATVYYSEGHPETVDIGEIHLVWEQDEGLLDMSSSGGSSNGDGHYSVIVKQPLTLEQVDYRFSERLGSMFSLSIAGQDEPVPQLPMKLAAGDPLTFNYQWTIPDDSAKAFEVYKTDMLLTFKTEDGRTVTGSLPINFNLYLNEKQLKRLVRSGGELS
ncbi:hypothetical protein KP806_19055 [Paenibacillus sp. N4]|uniref:hypothetical protein n=1 Tax=Paenibacillus vietnamensis TaxID=2590547 RepID=UPI001CD0AF7F|nr:hypothetical protein [Paenibacillus vietnamensis]MCA0757166.1 hypothetical protein [Paenibacillus vietnamensis]